MQAEAQPSFCIQKRQCPPGRHSRQYPPCFISESRQLEGEASSSTIPNCAATRAAIARVGESMSTRTVCRETDNQTAGSVLGARRSITEHAGYSHSAMKKE